MILFFTLRSDENKLYASLTVLGQDVFKEINMQCDVGHTLSLQLKYLIKIF